MDQLILYNDKDGNLMNCGFKLQTDGIENFAFVNDNKEIKDVLSRLTAPSGLYVNNKSSRLDNTNYLPSNNDIFDNLLELQATIDNNETNLSSSKKKSIKRTSKKHIKKSKKTTRKRNPK